MEVNFKKTAIVIIFCTIILVSGILILGYLSNEGLKKTAIERFNQQQLMLAKETSLGIENFIKSRKQALHLLAVVIANDSANLKGSRLREFYDNMDGFYSLQYVDRNGILTDGYPTDRIPDIGSPVGNFSASIFREGVVTKPAVLDYADILAFTITVPVYRNSNYDSAIIAIFDVNEIAGEFVTSLKSENLGYDWELDEKGTLLLPPIETEEGILEYARKNPWTRLEPIIVDMMGGNEGTDYYFMKNKEGRVVKYLIAYTPIELEGESLWSVVVCAPAKEAQELVHYTYIQQLYFLSMVVSVLVVGSLMVISILHRWNRTLEEEVVRRKLAERQARLLTSRLERVIRKFRGEVVRRRFSEKQARLLISRLEVIIRRQRLKK